MQSSKGEDEIELIVVWQIPGISLLEIEVGPLLCRELGPGKADHLRGAIKPYHRSSGNEARYPGSDLTITTTDIEYPLIPLNWDLGYKLLSPPLLRGRALHICTGIPSVHGHAFCQSSDTAGLFVSHLLSIKGNVFR